MLPLARAPRPTDIPGVVARLHAIEGALQATHGVAAVNRLYRWTTQNVGRGVDTGRFEAPAERVRLDVHFANLYFDAVDAWATDAEMPGAWAPLFERGDDPDIAPLRFALAGMHAHINRDLAVAAAARGRWPSCSTACAADGGGARTHPRLPARGDRRAAASARPVRDGVRAGTTKRLWRAPGGARPGRLRPGRARIPPPYLLRKVSSPRPRTSIARRSTFSSRTAARRISSRPNRGSA